MSLCVGEVYGHATAQSNDSPKALIMPFGAQTLQRHKQASHSSTSYLCPVHTNYRAMNMSAAHVLLWTWSWLTNEDRKENGSSGTLINTKVRS